MRVVPDVPSFAVDDGFSYAVPRGWSLEVGDVVRVPLSGRRVRGWVVGPAPGERRGRPLKEVAARWGDVAVFDRRLLAVLRWAAAHYVAPLATLLAKATPPNVPRRGSPGAPGPGRTGMGGLAVWVGPGGWTEPIAERSVEVVESGGSVLVAAPTWQEAKDLAGGLAGRFGQRVLLVSSHLPAAERTAVWVEAATRPGRLVVGTREVAWWRVPSLGLAVVVGEGRRGLKDKATPTAHARDVLAQRAKVEAFPLVVCDLVPTAESVLRADELQARPPGRAWGLVEVVDRGRAAPGGPLIGDTASRAIRVSVEASRPVLVFTHRRVAAQRCVRCRSLRRCDSCGAGPGPGPACVRCGAPVGTCRSCGGARFESLGAGVAHLIDEVARSIGRRLVGEVGSGRPVVVGTERDLPGLLVGLSVIVDADGLLLAPTYRAAEDGLRLLARVVAAAGPGRGRKAVLQTMQPTHPAIRALVSGDPVAFVRSDGEERSRLGFPPGGELLAVEATGLPDGWAQDLAEAVGERASVLGPAPSAGRLRWLLQAQDLDPARTVLRSVVARWREGGAKVRVDADPLDL